VAPGVVTVLAEELDRDAAQRAAEQVAAGMDDDGMRAIMRRLTAGPGAPAVPEDGGSVLGSGFILRADGLIVTNRHVVAGARRIHVLFPDGRKVPAELVGADAPTDIALLRVDAGALPALKLGTSQAVSVGDPVIAIGNPFGLGQTVTAGIISARGRALDQDPYVDFLQTDAAINHGNSGGPLLALDGSVVGITSVIFSPTGASVGLGFAIPAETIASVTAELQSRGRVDRGFLGITSQAVTPGVAQALGLPTQDGALIAALDPDGPSAKALVVGDVLLAIDGTPVSIGNMGKFAARLKPDTATELTVLRDGQRATFTIQVGRLPDPPSDPSANGNADTWIRGLSIGLASTTDRVRKALNAADEPGGLIVTQVRKSGPGALAGLRIGDLVTHAGSRRLTDVAELASVSKPTPQQPLLLRIVREGTAHFIAVTGSDES
jgi:serine protease Do